MKDVVSANYQTAHSCIVYTCAALGIVYTYEWNCQFTPSGQSLAPRVCPFSPVLVLDSAMLFVPSSNMSAGNVYTYTVTFSRYSTHSYPATVLDDIKSSSSAAVVVTVSSDPIPSVEITSVTGVNEGDTLRIVSSATSLLGTPAGLLRYFWSETSSGLDLSLSGSTALGNANPNLVVSPGVLQLGRAYTFQLEVQEPSLPASDAGTASVSFDDVLYVVCGQCIESAKC